MSAATYPQAPADDHVSLACALRDNWLKHGTSTAPADRVTAEEAVTELYGLVDAPRPRFLWIPSPAALPAVLDDQRDFRPLRLRASELPGRAADWPVAARLASLLSDLRKRMDARVERPASAWVWRATGLQMLGTMAPEDALEAGIPLRAVVDTAAHQSLRASLRDALRDPMRTALLPQDVDAVGLTWYGQHDAYWVAHYDVHTRLGLTRFHPRDLRQLAPWAALARSAGWWWPHDGLCVMSERPTELHTEPLPGGRHGELRLHHPGRPAVRFADGTELHALHGTGVPAWVIEDPTVERVHAETNVEVRRCAIERIGWDRYVEQADLHLVATAGDPGNPDSDLHLYEVPRRVWGTRARVLLVVNGSVEPDGRRRRYGLSVPADIDDPVSAAGWSYGLTGDQYAQLARRT